MKMYFGTLLLFFSIKSFAVDPDAFKENYPGFQNYQQMLFVQLRNYFEAMPNNSLNYLDANGTRIYIPRKNNASSPIKIFSSITRTAQDDQISEKVRYYLENGNVFEYELIKKGKNVLPSKDIDLLTFNFKTSIDDEQYTIIIPLLNIEISHSKTPDGAKDLFYFGFIDFNIQIESHFGTHEAHLDYIFFYRHMQNPQASLTVKAVETTDTWGGIRFYHLASEAGEITPQIFFKGLNDGAGVFLETSKIFIPNLIVMGFPLL